MGIDQRHEQLNANVKGTGGALGLTEDDEKLLRWMVCGPEESRIVREFKQSCLLGNREGDIFRHHDAVSFHEMFKKDIENLENEFRQAGNPFELEISELINLVTNDVTDQTIVS